MYRPTAKELADLPLKYTRLRAICLDRLIYFAMNVDLETVGEDWLLDLAKQCEEHIESVAKDCLASPEQVQDQMNEMLQSGPREKELISLLASFAGLLSDAGFEIIKPNCFPASWFVKGKE